MKKYLILIFLSLLSIVLAILISFFALESLLRIERYGFMEGIKSYFSEEVPLSESSQNDWVIPDEELGYRLNPQKEDVNQYSMKNEEVIMPKPEGIVRVVILGDSVPYTGEPNFVNLLRTKFQREINGKKIEIINASTPGYTNYQELIFLKRYILEIEPDLVILCYVLNDNFKFLHQFDREANMIWTKEAEESISISSVTDSYVKKSLLLSKFKAILFEHAKSQKNNKQAEWWQESYDFNTAWKESEWVKINSQIKEMKQQLRDKQARLIIVAFPLEFQVQSDFSQNNFELITMPQQQLTRIAMEQNIPLLDLFLPFYEHLDKNRETSLFEDGIHLTSNGHRLSSGKIEEFILQNL